MLDFDPDSKQKQESKFRAGKFRCQEEGCSQARIGITPVPDMRVLIATVTAGGGHLQAAAALREAWRALRPRDQVEQVDVLDFSPPVCKKLYEKGYEALVERTPELYGLFFKETNKASLMRRLSWLRRSLARATHEKFIQHLLQFHPAVVFCTHFMPLGILGGLMAKEPHFHPFTVCVVTDFEAHALWIEQCLDLYCVAAKETKASLIARGVPPAKLVVTGIPISASFHKKIGLSSVRKRYGLRDDLPTLLVLSGGFGMGPIDKVLAELDRLNRPVQVLAVTGRNKELRHKLVASSHLQPTRVLGFVANMNELMSIADLIVTKPGGLTCSEALAVGKPLLIINPIPGQETANSAFLLKHGAAVKVDRMQDLPRRIDLLLGSQRLREMSRAARAIGHRWAAVDICRMVAKRMRDSEKQGLQESQRRPARRVTRPAIQSG